jgi:hypothetical protein
MVAIYTFYRIIMVKGRLVNPFDSEVFDGESGDSADNGISGMRPVALGDSPGAVDVDLDVSIPPSSAVPDIVEDAMSAIVKEADTRRFPKLVSVDGRPIGGSREVQDVSVAVMGDVNATMLSEGSIDNDKEKLSERPTVPGFPAFVARFQGVSYSSFGTITNKLFGEFVYEWWFSRNPLERLYGQLNWGIQIFNNEQICADIVAVLGEDCLKEVFNADGKIGHDQWKLLKIEVENKYPAEDLAKIILRK